jgi:hypothetical protein
MPWGSNVVGKCLIRLVSAQGGDVTGEGTIERRNHSARVNGIAVS